MKFLQKIGVAVLLAALTTITTNLITGQPLNGIVKLKGLYQTFIKSSVPAWAFALVFLVALWGLYYALPRLLSGKSKGKVHFSPDAYDNGWSERGTAEMDVRISGKFAYQGKEDTIAILKIFLEGTTPCNNLMAHVTPLHGERPLQMNNVWLNATPLDVFTNITVKPRIGKRGKPLRARLILRDKYNRDFRTDPLQWPYLGS
jgi:hypothetical protein